MQKKLSADLLEAIIIIKDQISIAEARRSKKKVGKGNNQKERQS